MVAPVFSFQSIAQSILSLYPEGAELETAELCVADLAIGYSLRTPPGTLRCAQCRRRLEHWVDRPAVNVPAGSQTFAEREKVIQACHAFPKCVARLNRDETLFAPG
jgi:hypothetical protein